MSLRASKIRLTIIAGCLLRVATAGGGERDFLGKGERPGLKKDVQLWNAFLRSEGQVDNGVASDDRWLSEAMLADGAQVGHGSTGRRTSERIAARSGAFLDATVHQGADQLGDSRMEVALQSCLKAHFGTHLSQAIPMPAPKGGLAAVAAAAAAHINTGTKQNEDLIKTRLQNCMETTQKIDPKAAAKAAPGKAIIVSPSFTAPWTPFGVRTKNATAVKPALVATNMTDPCTKSIKQCKRDKKNCVRVLDILQFLRLHHIAVEKTIQAEATQKKQAKRHQELKLLQGQKKLKQILDENGLEMPKPDDWDWWTDAKHKLILQSALEQNGLALLNQDWNFTPSTPDLYHPIPNVPSNTFHPDHPLGPNHVDLQPFKQALEGIGLVKGQHISTQCPNPHLQKKLDTCRSSVQSCKVDVDDHNSILNSIAERAIQETGVKLQKYNAR